MNNLDGNKKKLQSRNTTMAQSQEHQQVRKTMTSIIHDPLQQNQKL
jgi:hypothetical protein